MKKVLFSLSLLLISGMSFAQVKNVKDAKSVLNSSKPDYAAATKLIQAAMVNPETKNDPETWNVAGLLEKSQGEKQEELIWLKKPYDTVQVYSSAYNMCRYFLKCDSLAQIPDAKGKVKNKYRKTNAESMLKSVGNVVNGGVYYYNGATTDDQLNKALDYFGTYVDVMKSPMTANSEQVKKDTMTSTIAYYAALAGMRVKNYPKVLKYATIAQDSKEFGDVSTEFTAAAYKEMGDEANFMETIKKGMQKYPNYPYFSANMIDYYTNHDKMGEAMKFADDLLAKDPNSAFNNYIKAYLCHNAKDYDNAITYYKKTIELDPNYTDAYSNLGLVYSIQAQDFSQTMSSNVYSPQYKEEQQKFKHFYELAKPCYEKARQLAPNEKNKWLNGLYRVYYNLEMGDEFKEIEAMMPKQ